MNYNKMTKAQLIELIEKQQTAPDTITVTDVQIEIIEPGKRPKFANGTKCLDTFDQHIKGLATVVLNGCFVVRGLRIMDGENGLFLAYLNDPLYKGEDFRTLCHPITRRLREHIEDTVLTKFTEITK